MSRLFASLAMITGALALPCLTACAPAGLVSQATSLFSSPSATTSSGTVSNGTVLSMRSVPPPSSAGSGMGNPISAMTSGPAGAVGGSTGGHDWSSMLAAGLAGGAMPGMGSIGGMGGMSPTSPLTPAPHAQAVEFTLHMDDGSTQTVVLGDAQGLHAGDRVQVTHGDRTRLLKAG
jgi:outer membrane lipoprotein SlyB